MACRPLSTKPPKAYNARVIGVTGEGGEADIKCLCLWIIPSKQHWCPSSMLADSSSNLLTSRHVIDIAFQVCKRRRSYHHARIMFRVVFPLLRPDNACQRRMPSLSPLQNTERFMSNIPSAPQSHGDISFQNASPQVPRARSSPT